MVLSLLLMIYCYQFSKFFKSCVRWEFSFCELAVTHDNRFENDQQFVERNSSIAVQVEENVENWFGKQIQAGYLSKNEIGINQTEFRCA